jgi:hypothetical protein
MHYLSRCSTGMFHGSGLERVAGWSLSGALLRFLSSEFIFKT